MHVTFPDLPGCVTFVVDEREAIEEVRDVLALHLWGIEDDDDVPPVPLGNKALAKKTQIAKQ